MEFKKTLCFVLLLFEFVVVANADHENYYYDVDNREEAAAQATVWDADEVDDNDVEVPKPSLPQLRHLSTDFVALIHFNMATFAHNGDPGCNSDNWNTKASYATGPTSDVSTFAPSLLNTSQWVDSIVALGANIAVLTAKHGCGFCLWPTNATLPDGSPYGYNTQRDVVDEFIQSAKARGIGYGLYYSIQKSFYLCRDVEGGDSCETRVLPGQHNVTNDEYRKVVVQHVTELWTKYPNTSEIWIDSSHDLDLGDLMVKLQPHAVGTVAHPKYWCGTESGYPSRDVGPGPIWHTGRSFHGNPNSMEWVNKFCDPQLFQEKSLWFWEPHQPIRTLNDMIPVYHDIVGRGMVMELAFSIDRTGLVEESHARVYKEFGDWVRTCYGSPLPSSMTRATGAVGNNHIISLTLSKGAVFDRIMVQEAIEHGQRIRKYKIVFPGMRLAIWGEAIGRKRIHLLPDVYEVVNDDTFEILLVIEETIATPKILNFAVFAPCAGPATEQQQIQKVRGSGSSSTTK